eukprot:scaffold9701_cov265-Ochromonas_danica.AAC.2
MTNHHQLKDSDEEQEQQEQERTKELPQTVKNENIFSRKFIAMAIGFAMRPLGGMLVGWIGDTIGRKLALEISIVMMLFPSFLIGCLPTYNDIGWWAPAESTEGKHVGFWGGACKATAYNVSHALFTSTVAVVQTSLILVASHGMKHQRYIEDHIMIASPHLLPAYYLIFISLITFMTLQLDNSEPHPILLSNEEERNATVIIATALTEDKLPSTAPLPPPSDLSIHSYGPTQPLLQARS